MVFLAVSITGCGYSTRSLLPNHIKTIYVEPFKNSIDFASEGRRNIYFPLLEVNSRNAIIERYIFDGNLRVSESQNADLVLKGELINYDRTALRYTDNDDVQEYRVYITVKLELWDAVNQEYMWTESSFTGEATYFITGALATTEESAVAEAITDLARRVVERTIENW